MRSLLTLSRISSHPVSHAGVKKEGKLLKHFVTSQVPVDQPLFSQDMIERWMQEALQASKKVNQVPSQKQDSTKEAA